MLRARVSSPVVPVGHPYGGTLTTSRRRATSGRPGPCRRARTRRHRNPQSQQQKSPSLTSCPASRSRRIWLPPDGVSASPGTCPRRNRRSSGRPRPCPCPTGSRKSSTANPVEVEAELASWPPKIAPSSRTGTLRCEAHRRHNCRAAHQSRPDALPTACCARRDPQAGRCSCREAHSPSRLTGSEAADAASVLELTRHLGQGKLRRADDRYLCNRRQIRRCPQLRPTPALWIRASRRCLSIRCSGRNRGPRPPKWPPGPSRMSTDDGYVRVQVLTNAGALDHEKQMAVV